MPKAERAKPLFIFYLLVAYVIIQFCWWAWHIYGLNQEIYGLKSELLSVSPGSITEIKHELDAKLGKRLWMVIGEGSVFLLLLSLGALQIRKTFKKEIALSRQQRNFLLSITHELKSPIASAKLHLQTLLQRTVEPEKQKKLISNTLSETERLGKLVDNLLLTASIDNNTYAFHKETLNLTAFIEETLEKAGALLANHHSIQTDLQPGIAVFGDKTALASLLLNLLDNAVKYSPENAPVTISLRKESSGQAVLAIADRGPGIPGKEKKQIFHKFYRVGNEETREAKGTGLGLFIAKYIAVQHNAEILVKNNSPQGSIFEVHFKTEG